MFNNFSISHFTSFQYVCKKNGEEKFVNYKLKIELSPFHSLHSIMHKNHTQITVLKTGRKKKRKAGNLPAKRRRRTNEARRIIPWNRKPLAIFMKVNAMRYNCIPFVCAMNKRRDDEKIFREDRP